MLLLSFSCLSQSITFSSQRTALLLPSGQPVVTAPAGRCGVVCVFVSSLSPPARTWLHVYCEEDSFAIPTARSSIFIEFCSYIARSRAFRDSWEKVVPGTYDYTWYLLIVRVNEYYARVGYPRALFGWISFTQQPPCTHCYVWQQGPHHRTKTSVLCPKKIQIFLLFFFPLRLIVMRDLSWGCKPIYFLFFYLVSAPKSEEIEPAPLGMSLTTLGEVPRSVFRFSRVAVARISDY